MSRRVPPAAKKLTLDLTGSVSAATPAGAGDPNAFWDLGPDDVSYTAVSAAMSCVGRHGGEKRPPWHPQNQNRRWTSAASVLNPWV